jgi:hypothetical protein
MRWMRSLEHRAFLGILKIQATCGLVKNCCIQDVLIFYNKANVVNQDLSVPHLLVQGYKSTEFDNASVVKGIVLCSWVKAAADGIKDDNLQTVFQSTSNWNLILIQFG